MFQAERPVLVIEDDDDSRELLAAVVASQGYPVLEAPNGADGLTLARRHKPCLILLDLMMPVMDGERFRTEQLRDADINDIPVVVVTARHDAQHTAERMGALRCIKKPIDFQDVATTVAACCGRY